MILNKENVILLSIEESQRYREELEKRKREKEENKKKNEKKNKKEELEEVKNEVAATIDDFDDSLLDEGTNETEESASRNILVKELIDRGYFDFSGYISNEVNTTPLVLFKALAKYYQIPFYESNKISTDPKYAEMLQQKPDKKTKKPFQYDGWLKQAVEDYKLQWEDVWDRVDARMQFCYDLGWIPYNASIAASGVILADGETTLPVRNGAITYNGKDLESWGYIKFDLLSVNTLNQIQYFKGLDFDWNKNDDPEVWKSMDKGDLDFVFQLSGGVPQKMCVDGEPNSIELISQISAINRPGPLNLELDKAWIEIQNGTYKFEGLDAVLAKILKRRFGENHNGMIVYQEDVMGIAQEASNFSLARADNLRKAMGKKIQELMDSIKPEFCNQWKYHNYIEIDDLGIFLEDDLIELENGSQITAAELYNKIENGEEVEVKTLI